MGLPQTTATKLHRTLHWPQNVSESTIPAVQPAVLAQEGLCSYLHPGASCSSSRGGSTGIFLGCSMLPLRECHFLNGTVEQEIWHCSAKPPSIILSSTTWISLPVTCRPAEELCSPAESHRTARGQNQGMFQKLFPPIFFFLTPATFLHFPSEVNL